MKKVTRRYSLLLEVLIAFTIVVLCILPLLYPHVSILRSQQDMVNTVELDHMVNLLYAKTLEKLYLNEIPWSTLEGKKVVPIDADLVKDCGFGCPTPYSGTFQFIEIKHKPKTVKDVGLYLFLLKYEFKKKGDTKGKEYKYQVLIKRKVT